MLKLLSIIVIFILNSCHGQVDINIEKIESVLLDNQECKILSVYPKFKISYSNNKLDNLNAVLQDINEMQKFVEQCKEKKIEEQFKIIGDYNILYRSDSIINFEYVVTLPSLKKKIFRSVFVNIQNFNFIESKDVFSIEDRTILYNSVKNFCDSSGLSINLSAYKKNSTYELNYGITEKNVILYIGGEGEFFGYYKVVIPRNSW